MEKHGPSITEKKLIEELRRLGLNPYPQYPISDMHVDIAFPEVKLVIEVNGPHHDEPGHQERDKGRYFVLRRLGWDVKSYRSESVYEYTPFIAKKIKEEIDRRQGRWTQTSTGGAIKLISDILSEGLSSVAQLGSDILELLAGPNERKRPRSTRRRSITAPRPTITRRKPWRRKRSSSARESGLWGNFDNF